MGKDGLDESRIDQAATRSRERTVSHGIDGGPDARRWSGSGFHRIASAAAGHLRYPLNAHSYILLSGNVLGGTLSFAFWALAARAFPVSAVGLASAGISAAGLVASFSSLGLGIAVIRTLKSSATPAELVNSVGFTIGAVSLTAGACALAILPGVNAELSAVARTPQWIGTFLLLVLLTSVFPLATNVLLAAGQSVRLVFVQVVQELAKIVALVTLAFVVTSTVGILLAAALGSGVAVVVAALRLLPESVPGYSVRSGINLRIIRPLLGYSAWNYVVRTMLQAPTLCLPLVVLWRFGPDGAAHYLPALIALRALLIVPTTFGNVLFASASRVPDATPALARRSLRSVLLITTVAVGCALLLMPVVGELLGPGYTGPAIRTARYAVLAIGPWSITYLQVSIHRVTGDARPALVAAVLSSVLALFGAMVFPGHLAAVSVGFVLGNAVAALAVMPSLLRYVMGKHRT